MHLNVFLFIIILNAGRDNAINIQIPVCTLWRSRGKTIIGSVRGQYGNNSTLLKFPTAIVASGRNNALYVVDSGNNRLMKYEGQSSIGKQITIQTKSTDGILRNPQDIAIDTQERIYISETGANRVIRWTLDPPTFEVLMDVESPGKISLDESTNSLYVVQTTGTYSDVIHFDLKSSEVNKLFSVFSNFTAPAGMHVDRYGTIFLAESGKHRIVRWSPIRRQIENVAGKGSPSISRLSLNRPSSVILDNTGLMYIADTYNNRILHWVQNASYGSCFINCSSTSPRLSRPYAIAFDNRFNFLIVEKDKHQVIQYDSYYQSSCLKLNCRAPILSLKNHTRIHSRNQPLTISIDADLNCSLWTTTTMSCTVMVCFAGDLTCITSTQWNTLVNSFRIPNTHDLHIPSFSLPVGTYNFSCKVTMTATGYNSTINISLKIIRSPIIVTLLPVGVSKVSVGYDEEYTFSPKVSNYNIDQNGVYFVYYCRKYSQFSYTTIDGNRLDINKDGQNPRSSTCFNLKAFPKSFIYDDDDIRTSLTIMRQSLRINQTYEFYVEIYKNKELIEKSDVILVEIQLQDSFPIEISPMLDTLILDNDYELFNPTTQIFLRSFCRISSPNTSIQWRIYFGISNVSSVIQWQEYRNLNKYSNQWFYGTNSNMFTVTEKFFSIYEHINYWQFQVIYNNSNKSSFGSIQLKVNHPPVKRSCSINPTNGSTTQSFNITCQNWSDLDGIRGYFLHVISSTSKILMSIAHSVHPVFHVHLPSGDPRENYDLKFVIQVRDQLGAMTKSNVIRVQVRPDQYSLKAISNFATDLPIIGDLNQVVTSYSTILNQQALNDQSTLIYDQVKISELMVSTFDSHRANTSIDKNIPASNTFLRSRYHRAIIREYLFNFYTNISIPTTIESIIILSSTLNQLIDTRSEWTRISLSIAGRICAQLSKSLYDQSRDVTIEEITLVANSLVQCTSNVFTGINGPLQQRGMIFDRNFFPVDEPDINYDDGDFSETSIPFCNSTPLKRNQICRELIINEDGTTREIHHKNFESYLQKRLANELRIAIDDTIFFIAKSIRHHLNIFQDMFIKFPVMRMTVEQIDRKNLENKFIDLQTQNATIYLPKISRLFHPNNWATLLPLAPEGGDANVNLSTALTLSILDKDDREIQVNATMESPIEMFIPRDVNLPIPPFIEQDMTTTIAPKKGSAKYNRQFFISYVNIAQKNPNLTISVHLNLRPINKQISYVMIYAFDRVPAYNSTDQSFDGWAMFCFDNLLDEMDHHRYYIDNTKTAGFQSLFFGFRELSTKQTCNIDVLPTITDQSYVFSNNILLRLYTSGCYYLNRQGYWKSDGMKVGKETNLQYTHCYSNHI